MFKYHNQHNRIMLKQKGQGTIEYLVIIAVIVVMALVVVALISSVGSDSGEIQLKNSRAYWSAQSPLAIIDSKVETDGTITLIIKNTSASSLSLSADSITFGGENLTITPVDFAPFAEKEVTMDSSFTGSEGDVFSQSLIIEYVVSELSLTKTISGTTNFATRYHYPTG